MQFSQELLGELEKEDRLKFDGKISILSTLSTLIFTQFLQSFLNAARAGTQLGSGPERHVFSLNTTDRTDDR